MEHNLATEVAFNNCTYLSKVDRETTDDAEDLVMPMYNLLECSSSYSDTTGSFFFF